MGEKIVMSADDRDARVAVDQTGLKCQSRDEFQWGGCRATVGVVTGNRPSPACPIPVGLHWRLQENTTMRPPCRMKVSVVWAGQLVLQP